MNKMQVQAESFHRALDATIGNEPAIREPELRVRLIAEESLETIEAIERGDLVEAIDGLCDLIYVAMGTAVAFGFDLEPFYDAVHEANMKKIGGPVRTDGKKEKPFGWQPPPIAELLEQARVQSNAGCR